MKELFIEFLYKAIKLPYQPLFKNKKPWPHTISDLLQNPQESLGFHLGCFLIKYNFEIQPSLEEHDVYHVLTNAGTSVKNEIEMQFYLLGNGKKSLFVFMVIATGFAFYPSYLKQFFAIYRKGKSAHPFHHLDFQKLLAQPVANLQKTFNIKPI